jgi:4-amino-4-deoxy-L-arabinose transferase-like glycosyltransferase
MSRGDRLLLVVLALAILLPGIGARDLWNPDEPRYAEVAREMREDGHWLVPHVNGRLYSEKPPLQFWAIAAASLLTGGVDEVSARLPAVLAAVATLLLLFGLAERLFDRRVAWWSALVFLTSSRILWQGRIGQIDMLLIALVTAAMYCFVRGLVEERPGFYRLFFVFAGLATLAKGPVGLLPPLLAVLIWGFASGRRDVLRAMRIPTGLLVWAAVVLAWLGPAIAVGGREYFDVIVFRQNVTRYAEPWHHFQPWYYYLTVVPADFFPWSFFLPGAIWIGWRRVFGVARRGVGLALAWMLVTLVFFSVSSAKRTVYVLTMYPAMALLVAVSFAEIESSWPRLRRFLTVPAALLALIATLAPVAGFVAVRFYRARLADRLAGLEPLGPGLLPVLLAIGLVLAVASQLAWLAARRGRPRSLVHSWTWGLALAAMAASVLVLPRFDAVKSARPLADRLIELAPPGEAWAIWPRLDAPFVFYTRRYAVELAGEAELAAFARRPERVWLLITKPEVARLGASLPLVEVARDDHRREGYVLLASRPLPAPSPP